MRSGVCGNDYEQLLLKTYWNGLYTTKQRDI